MGTNTTRISPVDGRYRKIVEKLRGDTTVMSQTEGTRFGPVTEGLRNVISERELAQKRIIVEGEYLIHLSKQNLGMRSLSNDEVKLDKEPI